MHTHSKTLRAVLSIAALVAALLTLSPALASGTVHTEYSQLWTGYAVEAHDNSSMVYDQATVDVTLPTTNSVSLLSGSNASTTFIWDGLGGTTNAYPESSGNDYDLVQNGLEILCGTVFGSGQECVVRAFYTYWTATGTVSDHLVQVGSFSPHFGDKITMYTQYPYNGDNTTAAFSWTDHTTGLSYSTTLGGIPSASQAGIQTSADFVQEDGTGTGCGPSFAGTCVPKNTATTYFKNVYAQGFLPGHSDVGYWIESLNSTMVTQSPDGTNAHRWATATGLSTTTHEFDVTSLATNTY